jgi:hypothetical protein
LDYLSQICNLAAVFAGFTAIVSVLGSDDETGPDDVALNKLRLRQMLEICLLTIATGLLPQLLVSFGTDLELALQISGAVGAASSALLLGVQGSRVYNLRIRSLAGFSVNFTRFAMSAGASIVILFGLAALSIRPEATYFSAVTLSLVIAGLQFLRTSTSVLRVPSHAKK